MKIIRKILKAIIVVILFIAGCLAGIIIYALISDYKPEEKTELFRDSAGPKLNDTLEFSFLTWNIGYCGLDEEMDFFYDGGTKVITPEKQWLTNLEAVKGFIKSNDSIDFFLIQEIDRNSKRSYHIDEYDTIGKLLDTHNPFFAKNYDVFFVPVPPMNPMGKVVSGLAIFSRFLPSLSERYQFPGEYGFPTQLFMLDRCFMVNRYPLAGGKELLVINTHNEAFDPGEIRKAQMSYLKKFLLSEYEKGNYIITGGDWNQTPPDFKPEFAANKVNTEQMMMETDFLPADWKWVYDNKVPSNRSVIAAYDPATTTTTVIDLFLLSPNVRLISSGCINLDFKNSDHNPVRISVKLVQ
jgi:endonuclease/exonuclease/phosphatase family metal-dependent hydrolase